MENIYDVLNLFKEKSKKYNKSVIDRRNFDLVEYILSFEEYDSEDLTVLDEEMLSNNMIKICEK